MPARMDFEPAVFSEIIFQWVLRRLVIAMSWTYVSLVI